MGKIQEIDVVRRVEVDLVEGEINRRSIKQSNQSDPTAYCDAAKQR